MRSPIIKSYIRTILTNQFKDADTHTSLSRKTLLLWAQLMGFLLAHQILVFHFLTRAACLILVAKEDGKSNLILIQTYFASAIEITPAQDMMHLKNVRIKEQVHKQVFNRCRVAHGKGRGWSERQLPQQPLLFPKVTLFHTTFLRPQLGRVYQFSTYQLGRSHHHPTHTWSCVSPGKIPRHGGSQNQAYAV